MSDGELHAADSNFAAWLRDKRLAAGFRSATAASKRAGVTSATWASWERGAFLPNPNNAPVIARTLRIDQREVLEAAGFNPDAYAPEVSTGDSPAEIAELLHQLPKRERDIFVDLLKSQVRLVRAARRQEPATTGDTQDDVPHTATTHRHVSPGPPTNKRHVDDEKGRDPEESQPPKRRRSAGL